MSIALSFSQLLAVIAQVERSSLSGGLVVARPEDAALLVFDRGILLHAEVTRARGRGSQGPGVLDELIGRRQATLAWIWPEAEEEAPAATVTPKDSSIFRRSLKMLARYGYFDDPQATSVTGEFFGVPDELLAQAASTTANIPSKTKKRFVAPVAVQATTESAVVTTPPIGTFVDTPVAIEKNKSSASRSVIANPQTALGKFIFNKALRVGGNSQNEEESDDKKSEDS